VFSPGTFLDASICERPLCSSTATLARGAFGPLLKLTGPRLGRVISNGVKKILFDWLTGMSIFRAANRDSGYSILDSGSGVWLGSIYPGEYVNQHWEKEVWNAYTGTRNVSARR
jgi:hypothetical protein